MDETDQDRVQSRAVLFAALKLRVLTAPRSGYSFTFFLLFPLLNEMGLPVQIVTVLSHRLIHGEPTELQNIRRQNYLCYFAPRTQARCE